jgi:hydroxymethylbilane synthase
VAAAALRRLGRTHAIAEVLDPSVVLPMVGQGALAVECRADDAAVLQRLSAVDHPESRSAVEAERAFLREIGEGCDLPVGALAVPTPDGDLSMRGMIASLDGHVVLRETASGTDPEELGRGLARMLLDRGGGSALLASAVVTRQ